MFVLLVAYQDPSVNIKKLGMSLFSFHSVQIELLRGLGIVWD